MSRSQRVLVVVIEHPLSWGDEKQRSILAAPRGLAARLVLEDAALRRQLVADAVGGGEVAALARLVAAGDGVLDRRPARIALIALEPNLRVLLEEAEEIAGGDERGGMARGFRRAAFAEIDVEIAQMLVHARQGERRVDVVAQRIEDGTGIARPVQGGNARMPDRAQPEIEAVERLLRLRQAFA